MPRIFSAAILVPLMFWFSSCGNSCRTLSCENGSYCYEGECVCPKWYSGDRCQLLFNRNYEGTYEGALSGRMGSSSALLVLTADEDVPNRLNAEEGFYLEFDSDSTLVIPVQSFEMEKDTVVVSGVGRYDTETISFRFKESTTAQDTHLSDDWLFEFIGTKVIVVQ